MRLPTALLLLAAAVAAPLAAQKKPGPVPLDATALSGQQVSLLPFGMALPDPSLNADTTIALLRNRGAALRWADSLLLDAVQGRASEVRWVTPADLRRMARRGGGLIPEPDNLGQAVMRVPNLERMPDPFRANLRQLAAIAGTRLALVPAALVFSKDAAGGLRADLAMVMGDVRTGTVVWRTLATGRGATPLEAAQGALDIVFPPVSLTTP